MESKVSVSFVRNVIYFAVSKGASLDELCRTAGITPDALLRPDEKIAGSMSRKLWRRAEELTADADIGLHIGEASHPSSIGLVGFVMLSCERLGDAFAKLIRYTNLMTDGVSGRLEQNGRLASIAIDITRDRQNDLLDDPRQRMETSFASIATIAKDLTGKHLPIREMRFEHARPAKVDEHRRIFGAESLFGQTENRMIFSADALDFPVLLANRDLLAAFEAQAEKTLSEIERRETRSSQVQRAIIKRLTGEIPVIGDVARELGLSERSLQRELASENTSYRELLDETRREVAVRHLEARKIPVGEIAFLLGFSEPSAFHRSFKRWTGTTPNAFRVSAKQTH